MVSRKGYKELDTLIAKQRKYSIKWCAMQSHALEDYVTFHTSEYLYEAAKALDCDISDLIGNTTVTMTITNNNAQKALQEA
jgi:hypothetical protein